MLHVLTALVVSCPLTIMRYVLLGDWMRTSSPDLETVIDAGVRVVIYDGDAVSPSVLGSASSNHTSSNASLLSSRTTSSTSTE